MRAHVRRRASGAGLSAQLLGHDERQRGRAGIDAGGTAAEVALDQERVAVDVTGAGINRSPLDAGVSGRGCHAVYL